MLKEIEVDDVLVLSLGSRLGHAQEEVLLRRIDELLEGGTRKFVVDLGNVQRTDSLGVGLLLSAYSVVSHRGGTLVLANVPEKILDLLQITQLITVLSIYSSIDEAIKVLHTQAEDKSH